MSGANFIAVIVVPVLTAYYIRYNQLFVRRHVAAIYDNYTDQTDRYLRYMLPCLDLLHTLHSVMVF